MEKYHLDIANIASVVRNIGTPTLAHSLDEFLVKYVPFDLSVIFGFSFDEKPLVLHDNRYQHYAAPAALEEYLNGSYLFDPFYTACTHNHEPGLWRMGELAPDDFFNSEFYCSSHIHPCMSMQVGTVAEEIGFLIPLERGVNAIYSLMRLQGSGFSSDEIKLLKEIEPFVSETVKTHWRDTYILNHQLRLDDIMETAFSSFCQELLTYQQRRIVQLILRGHSNYAIAQILSVTEGTIKLHRQNIYKRLNISSQRELFAMFVEQLFPASQ